MPAVGNPCSAKGDRRPGAWSCPALVANGKSFPGSAGTVREAGSRCRGTAAGVARFDACSVARTVLYNEVVYLIDGVFRLAMPDGVIEGHAGDVIWH